MATPETPKKTAPVVNDQFWLDKAKELVTGGVDKRHEEADKLVDTVKWLWTAYTAAAVVGFAVSDKNYPSWAIVIMVVPAVILPFALFSAVWVRNPVAVEFDSRSPSEIRQAYYEIENTKKQRLSWSMMLAVLGVLAVIAAIGTAHFAPEDETGVFSAALDSKQTPLELVAGGAYSAGTAVEFEVESRTGEMAETQRRTVVASPDGDVEARFAVDEAETYVVKATWMEEKVGTRSLSKEIKGTKPSEQAEKAGSE